MGRSKKEGPVEAMGTVLETLPNAIFKVELDSGYRVLAHIPGKTRRYLTRLLPGQKIKVELSPYDLSRGRILGRCE